MPNHVSQLYEKLRTDMDELQKKMTELEKQYQDLAESSTAAITSLVEQRRKLRSLILRLVEIGPSFVAPYAWQNKELSQLLKDCQEVL